jgi:hypothetical protein
MLETAMLKVYSTEALWTIVNDAFQIHGGAAYFCDNPLERILRDARINQIGEGANEVLTSFIALVGMREPGERLKGVWDSLPFKNLSLLGKFVTEEILRRFVSPTVPVQRPTLASRASTLSRLIWSFGLAVEQALMTHREEILEKQLVQEPIALAAMELYASICVLARLDAERSMTPLDPAADLFLQQSARRIRQALRQLKDNDNVAIDKAARGMLAR